MSLTDAVRFLGRSFVFCFFVSLLHAQPPHPVNFTHIGAEQGLISNSVLAITQDHNGFMWIGTRFGLTRYDGIRFRTYTSVPGDSTSLSERYILSLLSDSKNTLWIGTVYGLNKYNASKDAFERIPINGHFTSIHCIYEDKKGNTWIGSNDGLHLLGKEGKNIVQTFDTRAGLAGNVVRAVLEDHNGHLWIGTTNGLTKMQWLNGKYQFETLSPYFITSIAEDGSHNIWIGTQNDGLALYNQSTHSFIRYSHPGVAENIIGNSIRKLITVDGKVWAGTQDGLSIIDPVTKKIGSYQHDASNRKSLTQNSIYSLFEDKTGSVWIGTYYGGVNIAYSYTTSFNALQSNGTRSGLSNNVISSIVEDGHHNLWIGTEGGGLNYFDRTKGLITVYKNDPAKGASISSNLVKAVYLDKDGNAWAGTAHGGGLNVIGKATGKIRQYKNNPSSPPSDEILSLQEDDQGRLWVAHSSVLALFKRNKTDLQPIEFNALFPHLPPRFHIERLYKDREQNLWLGGNTGLWKLEGNTIKTIDSSSGINCFTENANGVLWMGLSYGGLAHYDPGTKTLVRYNGEQKFLRTANVLGLLSDTFGNLWLSTNNGLGKFNPQQNTFQVYTVSDGLAGNEFNYNSYLKDSKGEFFFGGLNGITSFFPDKIQTNRYAAPLAFTGLKLFNDYVEINDRNKLLKENITSAKEIVLKHDQNVFTIEFALLNFIKSDKNRYAYKLTGLDKGWNEISSPSVTYTNLSSGSYTFQVKGANNDGLWSDPISIRIVTLPPFWRTWWAYCMYTLAAVAVLFFILRFFFLRALLKKEDELHQAKLNFFTNISHEIRTHLTLIMTPVEQLIGYKEEDSFDHQQLTQVKNNSDRLLKLVNELMDFRKAETNHLQLQVARYNLILFLQDIYTSFRALSTAKNISLSFIHDREDLPVYFDKEQLEKVFFNLLINAFKFTPSGGCITIQVTQQGNQVIISVSDNGRGIAPQYLDKLFTNFFQVAEHDAQNTGYGIGLALSKHIIELHKGTIAVESIPAMDHREGSTIFTVSILQGNAHFKEALPAFHPGPAEKENMFELAQQNVSPLGIPDPETERNDKKLTILIVEDNTELRSSLRQTFIAQYHVHDCENGLAGWETATDLIPDLIICDVMMPGMDGYALCHKLKTDERTSHIPVILLTAKSSQAEQVSGLERGADIYLTKPFSIKILNLNVRNLLASAERIRRKFGRYITEERKDENFPEKNTAGGINAIDKEFFTKLIQTIEEHIDDPDFGVQMLSRKVAMSAPVLYKKIKAFTNMSVNEFVKSIRLKKAARLLKEGRMTVYEVAYAVGYTDWKYFSKEFKKQFGKPPSEFTEADDLPRQF